MSDCGFGSVWGELFHQPVSVSVKMEIAFLSSNEN